MAVSSGSSASQVLKAVDIACFWFGCLEATTIPFVAAWRWSCEDGSALCLSEVLRAASLRNSLLRYTHRIQTQQVLFAFAHSSLTTRRGDISVLLLAKSKRRRRSKFHLLALIRLFSPRFSLSRYSFCCFSALERTCWNTSMAHFLLMEHCYQRDSRDCDAWQLTIYLCVVGRSARHPRSPLATCLAMQALSSTASQHTSECLMVANQRAAFSVEFFLFATPSLRNFSCNIEHPTPAQRCTSCDTFIVLGLIYVQALIHMDYEPADLAPSSNVICLLCISIGSLTLIHIFSCTGSLFISTLSCNPHRSLWFCASGSGGELPWQICRRLWTLYEERDSATEDWAYFENGRYDWWYSFDRVFFSSFFLSKNSIRARGHVGVLVAVSTRLTTSKVSS